jgi:hypothetical protein
VRNAVLVGMAMRRKVGHAAALLEDAPNAGRRCIRKRKPGSCWTVTPAARISKRANGAGLQVTQAIETATTFRGWRIS